MHGTGQLDRNKANVVAYYTRAFNEKKPEDAVDKYGGFDKPGQDLDHSGEPHVHPAQPAREERAPAFIDFVNSSTAAFPDIHIDIRRVVAECDLVVTHGLVTGNGGRLRRPRQQGRRHLPARQERKDRRALGRSRTDIRHLCERQPGGVDRSWTTTSRSSGGGPAGLTAALFAARHGRTHGAARSARDGRRDPEHRAGRGLPRLPRRGAGLRARAPHAGAGHDAGGAVEMAEVPRIEQRGGDWAVVTDTGEIVAGAVIVATGSSPRKLGVPARGRARGQGAEPLRELRRPALPGQARRDGGAGDSALARGARAHRPRRPGRAHPPGRGARAGRRRTAAGSPRAPQVEIRHRTVLEEILGDGQVERRPRARSRKRGVHDRPGRGRVRPRRPAPEHRLPRRASSRSTRAGTSRRTSGCRRSFPGCSRPGDVRADAAGQAISAAGDGATAAVAAHRYLADRARATVRAWRLADAFGIDRLELEERPGSRARAGGGARSGAGGLAQLPRRARWSSTASPHAAFGSRCCPCSDAAGEVVEVGSASHACRSETASRASSSSAGSTATRSCPRPTARCSRAGSTACSPTTSSCTRTASSTFPST